MHRELLNAPKHIMVDHINRNTYDNQKLNLRFATKAQNAMNCKVHKHNTSGYKGVSRHKQMNSWRAYIVKNNKQIHIGLFKTLKEAALAYNKKALKIFGQFANINLIKEDE